MKPMPWPGLALIVGGALTIFINAALTPLVSVDAPFSVTAASDLFFWRQGLSADAAILLLAGSVGLHLRQAERVGNFGRVAFAMAFVGSAMIFAHEWAQVFYVRGLALAAPAALEAIDAPSGPSLFDIGALVALAGFVFGWLAFCTSMLLARSYQRAGPILVIAGFFVSPILSMALPGAWGGAIGNAVLGAGWILLGAELLRQGPSAERATAPS